MKKIHIIGGGIIGQFSAYYLRKSGHEVTIYDEGADMPNASHGNCGLITPSHILPMNSWSVIWTGMKWLGKKDAPLSIKPQLNARFISWFINFTRFASQRHVDHASSVRHQLLQMSWQLYNEFFEQESPDVKFHKDGLLYVCRSEKSLAHVHHEHDCLIANGLPSRRLSQEEIKELEPSIKHNIGGAIFECDGWLNPLKLNAEIKRINQALGVEMVKKEFTADDLKQSEADICVLAGGAKSALLGRKLGLSIDMLPGKGYNLTSGTALDNQPTRPIYMYDKKVVFTPWEGGFRLGSTMEFSGYNLDLNKDRLAALQLAGEDYLDMDFSGCEFTPWAGWRPMSSNSLPIIQHSKKHPKLILATGHGMLGLTFGPATGYLVDCLLNETPHTLHSDYNY